MLDLLPYELFSHITTFLTLNEMAKLSLVSSNIHCLIQSEPYFMTLKQISSKNDFCFESHKHKFFCNLTGDKKYFKRFCLTYGFNNYMPNYFRIACGSNHLRTVQWIWKKYKIEKTCIEKTWIETSFEEACTEGAYDVIVWLYETFGKILELSSDLFVSVCQSGKLKVAKWLKEKIGTISFDDIMSAFWAACDTGSTDIVNWIRTISPDRDYDYNELIFLNSITSNLFEIVDMLVEIFLPDINVGGAFITACEDGHLELAKLFWYLIPDSTELDIILKDSTVLACENDNKHIIEWLYQIYSKMNDIVLDVIRSCGLFYDMCFQGQMDLVKFIVGKNPKLLQYYTNEHQSIFTDICRGGSLEFAKWFSYECEIDTSDIKCMRRPFHFVCINNKIDIAEWLVKMCPELKYDNKNSLFRTVCRRNHLDCAKWLYDLDQKINVRLYKDCIFRRACKKKNDALIQFLCEICPSYINPVSSI